MAASLSRVDILHALGVLAAELERIDVKAELILVGGAAMSLLYSSRDATKDLDVYVVRPAEAATVRNAARTVAEELGLPEDWLNDAAKGFLRNFARGETVYDHPNLLVITPAAHQLLAMKLCSGRTGVDYDDVETLLRRVDGTREAIWAMLEPYLIPGKELTANYLFQDLWDKTHESG